MRRLLVLGCICCALGVASAAQSQDRTTLTTREAEDLQAIAREPSHQRVLWLGDGAPFQEHRDLFDRAFAACHQALQISPNDAAIRANLGALYLWRDAFHRDESGNFEKAIDQFLIVLRDDPSNEAVLTYLRAYEVLTRVRPQMAKGGMERIRSSLQHALKAPASAANLHTFARVMFFDGRMSEARLAAESLTKLVPAASSQLLLGSVELKSAHAEKSLTAFQTALKLTNDPVEVATAKLGAAQAYMALGNIIEADRMLADATAFLSPSALDHAARVVGLDTPAELGQSIGTAYAASGNVTKAVDFLSIKELSWLSSEKAYQKNVEGVKLYDANNFQGARNAFWAATQLIPLEPIYWRNAAHASFVLGRYEESMVAYRRADALEPLTAFSAQRLALSYAVLGDYRKARSTFERAARDSPDDKNLSVMSSSTWAVALAYAAGSWNEAEETWSRLVRDGSNVSRDEYNIFNHVSVGMRNIAERAEKRGALYQSLRHESVLYHILGEGLKRNFGREQIRREREETLNRIIDIYTRLPLKPVITPDVLELVQEAQPFVDSAFGDQDSQRKAAALYQQVIERAPWWPEGHYTLALLACWPGSMHAFGEESDAYGGRVGDREMNAYLALIPKGPDAEAARKILKRCY